MNKRLQQQQAGSNRERIERKAQQSSTAREAALEVLVRVDQEQAYSNLLLNSVLQRFRLDRQDAALATEIVYGTIQRLNTIDYFVKPFVTKGIHKLQPWVRTLLRLSFYQLYYLDRIPEHAIVNEAVNIAKKRGHKGISGMVNGVLRNIIRQKAELSLPAGLSQAQRIALEHSHPEWMVRRWIAQYGVDTAEAIAAANNEPPRVSVRANQLRTSAASLAEQLHEAGYDAEQSQVAPAGVIVRAGGNLALLPEYDSGLYTLQDESSMLVAEWLDPQAGEQILDCCAAPGGKTTHIAEKMGDNGNIIACDVHEHKEKLIRQQADRLGLSTIHTVVADARTLRERFPLASFDRILLDAPCSGLGVIRRKPDIKWTKTEEEISAVAAVQAELLEAVHQLLKPGGVLIYSTCTIDITENEQQIRAFCTRHPEFMLDKPSAYLHFPEVEKANRLSEGTMQLLPNDFGTDGFFIARLVKRA